MAYDFRIDTGDRLIRDWLDGDAAADDLREGLGRLLRHPDYDPDFDGLTDLSRCEPTCTYAEIEQLVEDAPAGYRNTGRWAIFAPSDLQFGMARMYETIAQRRGWTVRAFRSEADALAWLDRGEGDAD